MSSPLGRNLRYAMVGGGLGSLIGEAHRNGVAACGHADLVGGAFSQSYDKTLELGKSLGLSPERLYRNYSDLIAGEKTRPDPIDFAVICTPNVTHYEICKAFLTSGIPIACDKPLCFTVAEAAELKFLAEAAKIPFCVTFTYTAYPSVKKIRQLIQTGTIGDLRFVNAEYPQGWLAGPAELEGNAQAEWRCDPARSGPVNTTGDIGVHVLSIVKTMTGLEIESLCAQLNTIVPGRRLDDTVSVLVKFKGGAAGLYWACQAIVGYNNDLRVRIAGSKATIQWANANPDQFEILTPGRTPEIVSVPFDVVTTTPDHKAFVNIYKPFAATVAKRIVGIDPTEEDLDFPTVDLGIDGVIFATKCLLSSQTAAWVSFTAD
jgi:predicted dehydrogenase